MNEIDLAIVGLGTVGAMAAMHATARPGLTVAGFDQFHIGHGRGASAGESRLFRTAYHESPDYVPLLLRARQQWQELERVSGREIFLPTGTLSIGAADSPEMANVLASVTQHDLPHRLFDAESLAAEYPQHAISDSDIGLLDEYGGGLRPEVAVNAALGQAIRNGLQVHNRAPVTSIRDEGDAVEIVAGDTVVRARRVIVTAGPWTTQLLPQLQDSLVLKPIVLTWFLANDIRKFQPDVFPTFIRDTEDFHIFGAPSLDGYSLKVSVNDRWGTIDQVSDLPGQMSDETLAFLGPRVQQLIPDLHPEPVRHTVHMDAYSPDRRAIIGPLPDSDRVIVVAGLSGHGFKMSPVFGEAAVDLALEADPHSDITRFTPSRLEKIR